jgi:hypothetical protein
MFHDHDQPINVSAGAQAYGLHIRRTGHNPPRRPSADWWVLTTAIASRTNGLECLLKHRRTRENKYLNTQPMTDLRERWFHNWTPSALPGGAVQLLRDHIIYTIPIIHTIPLTLYPRSGSRHLRYSSETSTFCHNYLVMRNTNLTRQVVSRSLSNGNLSQA